MVEFEKDIVEQARRACRHVLPEQIVQGRPPQVCLTDTVSPSRPITGVVVGVKCWLKSGQFDQAYAGDCVLADPSTNCKVGGETEEKVRKLRK